MKRLSFFVTIIFIVSLFSVSAYAQEVLKLGIPLPLTGTNAKFGEIEKKSYEIAMEEINAKGGVKGKKIVLEFEDSQGKPEVARSIVERLIDVKKQPVVFGEYSSSCSKAIAAVAEERKVPYLVVTGATDDITQQKYKYVFRLNPTNAYYATGLMSFLEYSRETENDRDSLREFGFRHLRRGGYGESGEESRHAGPRKGTV